MTDAPNLYEFATKELAQDATLAYILAWAQPEYRESHRGLHELGTAVLRALLATKVCETDIPAVTALKVKTQIGRIDVLALINDESENGRVLLIEDKVETHEHSNQIERYIETAKELYPNREIVPVYVKTGNTSRAYLPDENKCGHFLRQDILGILNQHPDTGDTIIENFRAWLQNRENETNSYCEVPFSEWGDRWVRCEGFYMELENRMSENNPEWGYVEWGYVSNPAGGFLYFYFASARIKMQQQEFDVYFQIETYPDTNCRTRLTLRLGNRGGPKIGAELMREVFGRLTDSADKPEDLVVHKAGRFRGGSSGAVAEFTFGDESGYLALDDRGVVDMEMTMERLDRAQKFIAWTFGKGNHEV